MTKGSIKIGGVDVKDIEQKKLMDTVSFVFQDSKLLKMSIYDNVRMGKKDATREEVMEFLKIGRSTFYRLLQTGELKGFKEGNRYKVPVESVEKYVEMRMRA